MSPRWPLIALAVAALLPRCSEEGQHEVVVVFPGQALMRATSRVTLVAYATDGTDPCAELTRGRGAQKLSRALERAASFPFTAGLEVGSLDDGSYALVATALNANATPRPFLIGGTHAEIAAGGGSRDHRITPTGPRTTARAAATRGPTTRGQTATAAGRASAARSSVWAAAPRASAWPAHGRTWAAVPWAAPASRGSAASRATSPRTPWARGPARSIRARPGRRGPFDTDSGAITSGSATIRPAGAGLDSASGVYFSTLAQGGGQPGLGVFALQSLNIPQGATVKATGERALVIAATGAVTVDGLVDVSASGRQPGPGGHAGGGGGGAAGRIRFNVGTSISVLGTVSPDLTSAGGSKGTIPHRPLFDPG